MRIGALDLLHKIILHRPGIVCFVGKKIWDEFEFVIKRSAKAAKKPWRDDAFQLGEGTVAFFPGIRGEIWADISPIESKRK